MKNPWNISGMRLLWAMAIVALALGFWLTVRSARKTPDYIRWIERKTEHLEQLQHMRTALRANHEAVAAFEALDHRQPPELSGLIRETIPGVAADIRQRETGPAAEGWTVRRMEVELEEAPLNRIGHLLYRAESARPPWRLVECDLLASDRNPGYARVTLILEALEKR